MKKLFVLLFVFALCSFVSAQSDNWETINYTYSKGPVSPEYQLNYSIFIDKSGNGKLTYTRAAVTNEYDFKTGKKRISKLNKCLNKSEVFSVPVDAMKTSDNIIGGPTRNMQITMWQSPDLDQRPTVIDVPANLNEAYSDSMFNVYEQIENLVPESVWNKATEK